MRASPGPPSTGLRRWGGNPQAKSCRKQREAEGTQALTTELQPGNTRKEFGTSASRCLSLRGYAPAPQGDLFRQARQPAGRWRRSNSSLSPPAKLSCSSHLLTHLSSLVATYPSPRQHISPTLSTISSRGNQRRQVRSLVIRSTWLLHHSRQTMRKADPHNRHETAPLKFSSYCPGGLRRMQTPRALAEIDEVRPATDQALIEPS